MARINSELRDALDILGKERSISQDALFGAIESSLLTACRNRFGRSDNCVVEIDRETYNFRIYQMKVVSAEVTNPVIEIDYNQALVIDPEVHVGDVIKLPVDVQDFGRISTQNAKGVIKQRIREEERNAIYEEIAAHEHGIMTGVVQKVTDRSATINLGKADAVLPSSEQMRDEVLRPNQRLKVYVMDVKNTPRGPRVTVSRTHPDFVKCLFTEEVPEVSDGSVEILRVAREAGLRSKIAVISHDANVDPVGACVGVNGNRVNSIVDELEGEKIDIVNWDDNPAFLIENALSPAKVIVVVADEDSQEALVIVPDYQLSLAIGKEGQNARLAARLTGYKIDIKSESQAQESGLLEQLGMEMSEETRQALEAEQNSFNQDAGDSEAADAGAAEAEGYPETEGYPEAGDDVDGLEGERSDSEEPGEPDMDGEPDADDTDSDIAGDEEESVADEPGETGGDKAETAPAEPKEETDDKKEV